MYLYWTLYSTYIRNKINVQSKKLGKHHGYVKNNLMNSWESWECHIKKNCSAWIWLGGKFCLRYLRVYQTYPPQLAIINLHFSQNLHVLPWKQQFVDKIYLQIYIQSSYVNKKIHLNYIFFLISQLDLNVESQNYLYIIRSKITKLKSLNLI